MLGRLVRLITAVKRLAPKAACILAALAFGATLVLSADFAGAEAKSGGWRGGSSYSRPSTGGRGGWRYTRPSPPGGSRSYISPYGPRPYPQSTKKQSAGDLAQSRAASGRSLRDYRSEKEYNSQFSQHSQSQSSPASGPWGRVPRESYDSWARQRSTYYGGYRWSPPGYAYHSQPSFGMWDALWMWFMLDTLNRAGHSAFFYNHANDPGYQEWRREADRLAKDNAELKAKLDQLDANMKTREGQPRDPNYIPPDANRQVALSAANVVQPASTFPSSLVITLIILAGVGAAAYMYSKRMREQPVGSLKTYVENKLSGNGGDGYKPRLFRIGMVVTVDEAPFILAGDKLSVQKPGGDGEGRASAEAIGRLGSGPAGLNRIYVDGGFFQIHLDRAGQPDECRWFSRFDEFTPTGKGGPDNGDSWAFWLDDEQGQVGWPVFQTPDGVQYERAWAPGEGRALPVGFSEELTDPQGTRIVKHEMMLYQRPTDLEAPAPEVEYALLDVVEDGEEGSICIYVGVDINPASLSLA
jgi:hypothetical protein